MFGFQYEQTSKCEGCTKVDVCGEAPDVAALQDLLLFAVKGLSLYAEGGRKVGIIDDNVNKFACKAIFSTLTNVDFDPDRFVQLINECVSLRDSLKEKIDARGGNTSFPDGSATFTPGETLEEMVAQGEEVEIKSDFDINPAILSLREFLIYIVKGVAAYADHARSLGQQDDKAYTFIHEAIASTLNKDLSEEPKVGLILKCGEINLRAMELLDANNTGTYDHPFPTSVPLGAKKGKAIFVSGHDLKDLEDILKRGEGKGIFAYIHFEILRLSKKVQVIKF
jgi:hydroxylamine reductase